MTVLSAEPVDPLIERDVLVHLDAQLVAARRLLQIVLEQGAAIRNRDVRSVVALTGILQAELQRRSLLENERARLLERAGARLQVSAGAVTLSRLEQLLEPEAALVARARTSELRGLLEQAQREHYVNRVLMNQELAFLDHLLRLAGDADDLGYGAGGGRPVTSAASSTSGRRMLDLEV
jgi:FlgN protein